MGIEDRRRGAEYDIKRLGLESNQPGPVAAVAGGGVEHLSVVPRVDQANVVVTSILHVDRSDDDRVRHRSVEGDHAPQRLRGNSRRCHLHE